MGDASLLITIYDEINILLHYIHEYLEHKYTYFQCNLWCGRVRTGVYGCRWACMGVVGCSGTDVQTNKTKQDTNGFTGYVFDACMAGEISPKKTYMCGQT